VLHDVVGGFSNAGHTYAGYTEFLPVFQAVAGQHVNATGASVRGQFDIVRVITDHEGPRQVDRVLAFGSPQEVWLGFDAFAAFIAPVRTAIHRADGHTLPLQEAHDMLIDSLDIGQRRGSCRHSRLVGHDEQLERATQPPQCGDRRWEKLHLGRITQKSAIFNQSAVPIQKDGGPVSGQAIQSAPSRPRAKLQLLQASFI
jgi:hypothetical protein